MDVDGRTELYTPGSIRAKIVAGVLMDQDDDPDTGDGIELRFSCQTWRKTTSA